ncbi:MAG: ATP-binding cassette domain-containing protein [Rhodoglobus sp.]
MTDAITVTGLSKAFGSKLALDSVELTVSEGSIFGFLGPNGAGKTTMLRILTGLAKPTGGTVTVLGRDIATAGNSVRSEIGFLPDVPAFYEWMTAEQFLNFAGSLFGLRGAAQRDRVEMLLDLAGLGETTARIGEYSRGMKQRLGIAQALVNAPRLLLLDEPTSALDPIGRKEVLDMVGSLRGRTTVFFSTHILGDVERVCDTVAILDRGRVVAHGPIHDLKRQYGREKIVIQVTEGSQVLAATIETCSWAVSVTRGPHETIEVAVTDIEAARHQIPALVAAQRTGLVLMEAGEMGLEEVFVELVGGTRS